MANQPLDGVQTYLDNIETERQRAWNEANEVLEAANKRDDKKMTPDEQEKWDRIAAEGGVLDQLKEQADTFANRVRTEKEHDQLREEYKDIVRPADDGQREQEMHDFEKWVRGQHPDTRQSFAQGYTLPYESMRQVYQERQLIRAGVTGEEFRDQIRLINVTTTTQGKNLVPTDFLRRLYDFMEAASGMRRTRATILTTAGGEPLQIPTVTAHGTAAIVGEGTALAEADAAFGQVTLGAYKYGQLAKLSTEMLQDTGVDVLGFLARDLGRALGRATGTAYVNGSGTNAPHGLGPRAGTATTIQTVSTGVPSYANLVDTVYSVIEEYRSNGAQWMMRDSFEGAIRKLTDTQGRPLWQPVVQAGEPDLLLGYPVIDDRNMDAAGTAAGTPIFFGDFEPFYIRDAGAIRIERSDDFLFSSDIVTYRALQRTDSDLIDLTGAVKKVLAPTT